MSDLRTIYAVLHIKLFEIYEASTLSSNHRQQRETSQSILQPLIPNRLF